jgi:hypothetical protein
MNHDNRSPASDLFNSLLMLKFQSSNSVKLAFALSRFSQLPDNPITRVRDEVFTRQAGEVLHPARELSRYISA